MREEQMISELEVSLTEAQAQQAECRARLAVEEAKLAQQPDLIAKYKFRSGLANGAVGLALGAAFGVAAGVTAPVAVPAAVGLGLTFYACTRGDYVSALAAIPVLGATAWTVQGVWNNSSSWAPATSIIGGVLGAAWVGYKGLQIGRDGGVAKARKIIAPEYGNCAHDAQDADMEVRILERYISEEKEREGRKNKASLPDASQISEDHRGLIP